jgi:NADH-quinone oxidoreductase subunit L
MLEVFVAIPFIISALLAAFLKNDKVAGPITFIAGVVSILFVGWLFLNNPGPQSIAWFSVGGYVFAITTTLTLFHMIFLALIAVVSTIIVLYAIGFMNVPSERRSFYIQLSLFAAGMMLFAIGADLITLFIAWELIGLTSYLLIGFWRYKDSAIAAAKKAVMVLFIGDILVFAGIAILWSQLHSLSLDYILANATGYWAGIAALLIVIGAFTKSAQFPFHEWLTDAMEGPTPVSALLHSSTMVKAGVFLIAILLPFILRMDMGPLLIGVGVVSVVIASINAMSSNHIKKILAYSTIEDMGLMFIALGFGSIIAAMMLFIFQAFYKSLIFMSAGEIMRANKDREDIRKIAGPRKWSIMVPALLAVASLVGIFPLGGFFGKVAVESAVQNFSVYAILLAAQLVASMYIFRWLFTPLSKDKSKIKTDYKMPRSMRAATYILSAFILATAVAWMVYFRVTSSISAFSYQAGAIYSAFVAAGLLLAYIFYYRRALPSVKIRSALGRLCDVGYEINFAYRFATSFVRGVGAAVDVVDYEVYRIIRGGGSGLGKISAALGRSEGGSINVYLAVFVIGTIVAMAVFLVI